MVGHKSELHGVSSSDRGEVRIRDGQWDANPWDSWDWDKNPWNWQSRPLPIPGPNPPPAQVQRRNNLDFSPELKLSSNFTIFDSRNP